MLKIFATGPDKIVVLTENMRSEHISDGGCFDIMASNGDTIMMVYSETLNRWEITELSSDVGTPLGVIHRSYIHTEKVVSDLYEIGCSPDKVVVGHAVTLVPQLENKFEYDEEPF